MMSIRSLLLPSLALLGTSPAVAAVQAEGGPRRQGEAEAVAMDAAEYAARFEVAPAEAARRLRAQQESVAATDRIAAEFRSRLAGISIEHQPGYRIVVLLSGSEPVPDRLIRTGGLDVLVVFRTGAPAARDRLLAALLERQPAIRVAYPQAQGIGLDQRTGELVLMLRGEMAEEAIAATATDLETIAGVPVRVRLLDREDVDLAVDGGSRLVGVDPANGRHYACTTGFVVTDGARTGIVTAAHCPDQATYQGPDGAEVPLDFAGGWGVGHQDVQLHLTAEPQGPYFFADRERSALRTVTTWRTRAGTRAGDFVCHRGEASGYSCAPVELTDFSPPGDLCGGPCSPSWVTVAGPNCRGGDSGGPVFSGTVAFGIAKGGSYGGGECRFYYYMSTDYLPAGWQLLTGSAVPTPVSPRVASE